MKTLLRAPLFGCALFCCALASAGIRVSISHGAATTSAFGLQNAYGSYGTISATNTASLPTPAGNFTTGSSVLAAIPSNCGSITVSVMLPTGQSSWTGQLHVYGSTGTMGAAGVSPRYDQVDGVTVGTTALPPNAVGVWTFPVPVGTAGVICTSFSGSVQPIVVVLPGPTLTPTVVVATVNGITSLSHISAYPATAQAVTSTPVAWVTNSGTALANRLGVLVSNYGTTDMWLSSTSAATHGIYVPGGTSVWVPFNPGNVTWWAWCSGSTTYDATEYAL